ncbi:MAG: hypothetical protein ACTSUE_17060 [Promethearchaeota archaeon]
MKRVKNNQTDLVDAVRNFDLSKFKHLLNQGVNPNFKVTQMKTPLLLYVYNYGFDKTEWIEALLNTKGVQLDMTEACTGNTFINTVVRNADLDTLFLILNHRVVVGHEDDDPMAPVIIRPWIMTTQDRLLLILELIIKSGKNNVIYYANPGLNIRGEGGIMLQYIFEFLEEHDGLNILSSHSRYTLWLVACGIGNIKTLEIMHGYGLGCLPEFIDDLISPGAPNPELSGPVGILPFLLETYK